MLRSIVSTMNRTFRSVWISLMLFVSLFGTVSCVERRPAVFTLIETCDMHGVMDRRMGSLGAYVRDKRAEYGRNLLLFDGGDNLQGTSQVFFSNSIDHSSPHIYSSIFNGMGYDAITVGNHDFEAGEKTFKRVYRHVDMPVLSANILDAGTGKPYFKPYTVLKRSGYRIAVLGLTSKYSLDWLPENTRRGFEIMPLDKAAAYWVEEIRRREKPDIVIGLFHSGYNESADKAANEDGTKRYNPVSWIARNVPGFDLICCAHTHELHCGSIVNIAGDTVHLMQGGAYAEGLAEAVIRFTPDGDDTRLSISTRTVRTATFKPDEKFMSSMADHMQRAQEYERKPVCTLTHSIRSNDAFEGPSAWVELLHSTLRDATELEDARYVGIDATIASPSLEDVEIDAGTMTIGDCILLYPYENTVSICEMTGDEIRQYLEYVYDLRESKFSNNPIYYFDSIGGINYIVDRSKPKGRRVTICSMSDGNPCFPSRRYHVAMTSFRAQGGGGHLSYGLGWSQEKMNARCIWESNDSFLEHIMQSLAKREIVDPEPSKNWSFKK